MADEATTTNGLATIQKLLENGQGNGLGHAGAGADAFLSELSLEPVPEPVPKPRKFAFPLVRFKDIKFDMSPRCIVEDLIPQESLVVFWGGPKSGNGLSARWLPLLPSVE